MYLSRLLKRRGITTMSAWQVFFYSLLAFCKIPWLGSQKASHSSLHGRPFKLPKLENPKQQQEKMVTASYPSDDECSLGPWLMPRHCLKAEMRDRQWQAFPKQ